MKPGHKPAPDLDDELADPVSTVRPARRRLDPRLDEIAEAARQGRLTDQEAVDQIVAVLSEVAGRMLPKADQLGVASALRLLARDPRVLAMLSEEDE